MDLTRSISVVLSLGNINGPTMKESPVPIWGATWAERKKTDFIVQTANSLIYVGSKNGFSSHIGLYLDM